MGVELKWEVDAAENQARQGSEARPAAGRLRRRLLLFLLLCVVLAGGVFLRLQELERQQENLLRATVEAEVTALRLGDEEAFLDLQDSGDPAWRALQRSRYAAWQARKLEGGSPVGGEIVSLAMDDEQAWVQVQEIIAGEPRLHTWHYRFTAAGWRHVATPAG